MKVIQICLVSIVGLSSTLSYSALSISEELHQPIGKIERPENCMVREDITRNPLPPTPNNMSLPDFGQGVIGWGTGPEGALAKIQNLHLSDIETYQQKGVTLEMIQSWQAFYQNETKRNSCNPTAPLRAELMHKIIMLWSSF